MLQVLHGLTFMAWIGWLYFYSGAEFRMKSDVRTTILKAQNSRMDRVLVIVLGLAMIALTIFMLVATFNPTQTANSPLMVVVGLIVSLVGIGGTFYCRRFLGRFWRPVTAIQPDHEVVQHGPYTWIRHPIYLATLVMFLGLTLAFSCIFTWILLAILIVGFVLKTFDEERFLSENLDTAYQDYRNRVPYRLVPGVW